MDEKTTLLISQILLDDLQELSKHAKGKQRADQVDDFQLAVSCYEAELAAMQGFVRDKQMSLSIARAVCEDAPLLAELNAQESQAAKDRALALNWSDESARRPAGTHTHPMQPPTTDEARRQESEDELVRKLAELYMFGPDADEQNDDGHETGSPAESSAWAASRPSGSAGGSTSGSTTTSSIGARDTTKRQCVICLDKFHFYNIVRAACSHEYCRHCFEELFRRSLTDETLFPPRCCGQAITINQANRIFLPAELVGKFEAKKVERETPNPTYCYRPNCSTFIPLQFVRGDVATCVRCPAATCTICKGATHQGDCPEDTTTQEVLRVAAENEWQRCPSCRRVVELRSGCYHITCLCRAQFCYVCAATWKTCTCPQWQEERLVERAGVVVDRNVGNRVMAEEERAQRIQQAARRLADDHECAHNSWGRIAGPRVCEECGDRMPIWLNVCRQCQIMVCRRCRYNRL